MSPGPGRNRAREITVTAFLAAALGVLGAVAAGWRALGG